MFTHPMLTCPIDSPTPVLIFLAILTTLQLSALFTIDVVIRVASWVADKLCAAFIPVYTFVFAVVCALDPRPIVVAVWSFRMWLRSVDTRMWLRALDM